MEVKRNLLLHLLLVFSLTAFAQRTATVEWETTFSPPEYMSLKEAKNEAIRRAQIEAIAAEFGTMVERMNTTEIANINGISDVAYSSVGFSDVRGEWIKTIGKPQIECTFDNDHHLFLQVKIKGQIREIEYLRPEFEALILRNGTDEKCESREFNHGDYLYMSFTTPAKGHLAVFVKSDSIRTLLPDVNEESGCLEVSANKRHLFFHQQGIDRLQTFCDKHEREMNIFFILFSPHPIVPPLPKDFDADGIPLLSDKEFQKWLVKARSRDKELQIERISIIINK